MLLVSWNMTMIQVKGDVWFFIDGVVHGGT